MDLLINFKYQLCHVLISFINSGRSRLRPIQGEDPQQPCRFNGNSSGVNGPDFFALQPVHVRIGNDHLRYHLRFNNLTRSLSKRSDLPTSSNQSADKYISMMIWMQFCLICLKQQKERRAMSMQRKLWFYVYLTFVYLGVWVRHAQLPATTVGNCPSDPSAVNLTCGELPNPTEISKRCWKKGVPLLSIACNVQYVLCNLIIFTCHDIMSCLVSRWEPSLWLDNL